jgi:hypothetical protein
LSKLITHPLLVIFTGQVLIKKQYIFFIFTLFSVPRVLMHCAEFIETAGMIDGIYRLSGIASNIQKLRVAFDEDRVPNLYQDKGVIQVNIFAD